MHRGYVKVWRCISDTGMLKNHGLFTLWMQCLLSASHKAHSQIIGNQKIDLLPGQFVFGRKSWADKLGATEKQVRVWVETLQKHGRIEATTRASKFTVFSVVNWECYQEDTQQQGQQQGQQAGQQGASKGPARGHKQELKNEKNEKNKGKENIPHGDADAGHTPPPEPFYLTKKKRKLQGKRLEAFNRFWAAFAYPKGKAEAADAWLDIPTLTDSLVETIVAAAEAEATGRADLVAGGHTPKWAQGWITGRRWEDEAAGRIIGPKTIEQQLAELEEYRRTKGVTQ